MKNEDLLKAIGNIDDELIDDKLRAKETVTKKSGFRWMPAIKTAAVCVCAFALVLGVTLPNIRMGASKSADYAIADVAEAPVAAYDYPTENAINGYISEEYEKTKADASFEPAILPSKLIYRANVNIETEDFDKTTGEIKELVNNYAGYFENSESYNGSYYYDNANKNGWFTVRVPQENYESFINELTANHHITSRSENVENITESYYDTQDRLDTLKIKEERLHELLSQASSMSDILEIESSLSDTESQINNLTKVIKGYDNMTDYASITIDVCQVRQMGSTVGSEGFGTRIIRALKNGLTNFAEGTANFFVFLSYNVIEIVLIIVAVILIWRFKLIKKIINWIRK